MESRNLLKISAIVCTYNEERNIGDCIKAIKKCNPKEILVIDGGSIDNTVEIAKKMEATIVNSEKGLSNQRQVGINYAKQPFLAFVDADDRLDKNCLKILLKELEENNFDAIQAKVDFSNEGNYWENAMNFSISLISNKTKVVNMIGRPALYRTDKIKNVNFDGKYFGPGIGCEDTDLSIRFEKAGYVQAIGTGISKRIHASTFRDVLKKIKKYGRGDARIIFKFPEKRNNILRHLLWNYPFRRSLQALKNKGVKYIPFFILMGFGRFVFLLPEYYKLKIKYGTYKKFK